MHFAFLVSNLPSVYDQLTRHAPSQLAKPTFAASIQRAIARWMSRT